LIQRGEKVRHERGEKCTTSLFKVPDCAPWLNDPARCFPDRERRFIGGVVEKRQMTEEFFLENSQHFSLGDVVERSFRQ
jgi:hypothetical protein